MPFHIRAAREPARTPGDLYEPGHLERRCLAALSDPEALATFVTDLLPRIRNLVRFLVRGDRDIDDIAQEVLVVVIRGLPTFRARGSFLGWLDRTVSRATLAEARRRRIDRWFLTVVGNHEDVPVMASFVAQDDYVARRWAIEVLDELPADQRYAVVLHDLLGWTVPEVAAELEIPIETLRSRVRLGRQRLRASGIGLGAESTSPSTSDDGGDLP